MTAIISASNLQFGYSATPVLKDIELSVAAGEIYGLVGADGAGKSTLLQLMVGQLVPKGGSIRVLSRDPTDPALRDDLAYMPQGFGLYLDLSIQENLEFFSDLHGMDRKKALNKISDLLERTGLKGFEERRAGQLSGGMMQKLALACALVTEPRVMFLDEPTTGVDPVSRRAFWLLLEAVRTEGVAILYATANMDEAERCDRVGLLEDGWLTRQGTPQALVAAGEGILVAVSGPAVRGFRAAVRQMQETLFVFTVGSHLNVWLRQEVDMEAFRRRIGNLDNRLEVQPLVVTLHDATVRDLALAAAGPDAHA